MNEKRLLPAWVMGISLISLLAIPVCSGQVIPNSSPQHRSSKYDYKDDDIPDVCFFPKDKARWDGYAATNWDWLGFTDYQKEMFISEGIAEIERTEHVTVAEEKKWRLLNAVNTAAGQAREEFPTIKKRAIKILLDSLKESGLMPNQ